MKKLLSIPLYYREHRDFERVIDNNINFMYIQKG